MAQLGTLRDEIYHLKDTIREHGKELSHLHFKDSLAKKSWQTTRESIDSLKEDSYFQQKHLHDLTSRISDLECELEFFRPQFNHGNSCLEKDAIYERVDRIEYALSKFTELHSQLKDAVLAFESKAKGILRATLRMGSKVREEDLSIELLID